MHYLLSLALGCMLVLGWSSCGKDACYECTHPSFCNASICDGGVNTDDTCTGGSGPTAGNDFTNEQYREAYENNGYTCTAQ